MGDDITIGVTEIVNNIEVTAQPNDQIVDISVIDNADDVTLNITPTVIEINVNKGSSYAKWGTILGTLSDQTDLQSALNDKVPYSGASGNVNLGEYGITSGYVGFDTTPTSTPTGIGTMYWDSANRTVSLIDGDGDTTLQIGQEQRILVHNNTGSTLTDGQVVYVTGSTGNLPSVALASATIESTSAATIGVVTESIANGADGFITTSGIVNGLNTLAFNEGDLLWLGTTAGTFSTTKPISPNHLVLIGYVIKKAGGNGSILVKIQNTQELDECSDVLFSGLANNDLLVYETASALWKNKSLATVLGYTPANDSNVVHKTGNESIAGWKTFTGGITLWDNSSNNLLDFFISGTEVGSIDIGSSFFQFKALNSNGYLFKNNSGSNSLTISNSGNGTFLGSVTATSIIKSGGTSSQFLKADGSVDSNTYATTSQLHNAVTIGTANGLSLSTQVLSLGLASSSTNGALSSTDWNTFNNKQSALSGTGFVKISGTAITYDNSTYALDSSVVKITGDQSISGTKIFSTGISTNTITSNSFIKTGGTSSQFLKADGSVDSTSYQPLLTNPITGTGTTNYLPKFTGSTALGNSLIYDNGTNVGIGTTSPDNGKLTILKNTSNATESSYGIAIQSNASNAYTELLLGADDTVDCGVIQTAGKNTSFTSKKLALQPNGGNVGIGTTSPSYILQTKASSGFVGAAFSSLYSAISIIGNDNNSSWFGQGTNGLGAAYVINNTSGYAQIELGGSPRFYVNSSGNVGIGTTSPINGGGAAKWITIDGTTNYSGGLVASINGNAKAYFYSQDNYAIVQGASGQGVKLMPNGVDGVTVLSGGNVGIGTTAPTHLLSVENSSSYETASFKSSSVPYQIIGNAAVGDYWRGFFTGQNIVTNATTGKPSVRTSGYTASAIAYSADSSQGYLGFFTTSSTTANTDLSERMRITSSGNVGIGTTSPNQKLEVNGNIASGSGINQSLLAQGNLDFYNAAASSKYIRLADDATTINAIGFSKSGSTATTWFPSGNVGIGTTSPSSKFDVVGGSWVSNMIADDAVGNSIFIRFNTSATSNIGSITRSGSTSAVSYNTTSDYRLKEDLKNYSGLDLISNINTYDFKWKNSEDRMYGVIAHELQEVVPYAVNGEKDAEDMQQVDYSKLVPILVEAIKELKAEIEILKNK